MIYNFSSFGHLRLPSVVHVLILKSRKNGGENGYVFEEEFFCECSNWILTNVGWIDKKANREAIQEHCNIYEPKSYVAMGSFGHFHFVSH